MVLMRAQVLHCMTAPGKRIKKEDDRIPHLMLHNSEKQFTLPHYEKNWEEKVQSQRKVAKETNIERNVLKNFRGCPSYPVSRDFHAFS
jgi:hypothetical protein